MAHITTIALPHLHMAGSDAHHRAHIDVGPHGFSLFLTPESTVPVLDIDIDGTPAELEAVLRELQAALTSRV